MIVAPRFSPSAWLAFAAATLMCVLPALLGIHVLPLVTFYEEWLAAALGTAACAAALLAVRKKPATVPVSLVPLFGLLAVLALQIALGKVAYAQQATLAMLYTVFAMAMMWCGVQLRDIAGFERTSRAVASALLMGGVLSALLALVQAYAPDASLAAYVSPLTSPRVYGNINQANLFADQLMVAVAALLYLYVSGVLRLWPAAVVGVVLAVGLTLSGSRSVWLYGAWLLAWTLYVRFRSAQSQYRKIAVGVTATLAALAVLSFTLPSVSAPGAALSSSGLERLAGFTIDADRASSEGLRIYFWRHAWEMFKSAPAIGVGVGQFAFEYLQQSVQFAGAAVPGQERNAHNIVLHLLAETGFIGALSVVLAVGLWLWQALRAQPELARWWIVAVVGIVLLHSLLEYPLWYAHFLGPFALLLGVGETRRITLRQARVISIAIAGIVLLGAAVLGSLFHGFGELRRWVYLVPEEALRNPAVVKQQEEVVRRLQPTLLGPYVDLPLAGTIRIDVENIDAKLAFNARVMRFAPIAQIVLRQVVFLALAGREAEARRLLDAAAVIYPGELAAFAADLERLSARGLPVSGIAAHLAEKRGKN